MAKVIITFSIMPEGPDVNLKDVEEKAKELIGNFGGEVGKVEIEPFAFGLNSLKMMFVMDESKGDTESLEKDISDLEGIVSVRVVDVRRAIG